MAAVVAGQIYQVTLVGALHNQRTMNTFHYEVENVPAGGATVVQAAAALETAFEAAGGIIEKFLDCTPDNYTLAEMWIQCIGPTERYVKVVVPESLSGQWTEAAGTANLSAVITRTTEKSGRSQQSSLHIPIATGPDTIFGGNLDADLLFNLNALAAVIPAQFGVVPNLTFDPVIYHGPPPFLPADRIETATAQTTVRVMRRRTVGLGI